LPLARIAKMPPLRRRPYRLTFVRLICESVDIPFIISVQKAIVDVAQKVQVLLKEGKRIPAPGY
jgi:hypothetical protein